MSLVTNFTRPHNFNSHLQDEQTMTIKLEGELVPKFSYKSRNSTLVSQRANDIETNFHVLQSIFEQDKPFQVEFKFPRGIELHELSGRLQQSALPSR